ncbi:MAG: LysM peptidoglycan-binding domain-containing protein [Clostridia bacterium]|nr:LysM peptidoglycan-binding domain-containing protein [Clostridia bacterium]
MEKLESVIINNKKGFYYVLDGETISDVAKKFSTTERVIFVENMLSSGDISGKVLYVKSYKKIYIVKEFDTLDSVCEKFNVQKEIFKKTNYVDYVFCGQRVIVDGY